MTLVAFLAVNCVLKVHMDTDSLEGLAIAGTSELKVTGFLAYVCRL